MYLHINAYESRYYLCNENRGLPMGLTTAFCHISQLIIDNSVNRVTDSDIQSTKDLER